MMLTANATSDLSPFPSNASADRSADECSPPTTNGSPSPKSSEGNGSQSATYSPSSTPTTRNDGATTSTGSPHPLPSLFSQTSAAVPSDLNAMFSAIFENNNKLVDSSRAQLPNPLATSASAALLAAQQQFQQLSTPALGMDQGALLQLSQLLAQQQTRLHLGKHSDAAANRMPPSRSDDVASQDKKRTYPYTFQFCVLCQKNVHSSKLPCHIRQCHVSKPMFQCPACDFTSTYSKNNVKSHMVSLHGLAGDPISYMDQYAGQVEEFMKKCFPNVRGRGRPVHGRSSPMSPSLANGSVNGTSVSGDATPTGKRPPTVRHSHSRQQRHRGTANRFPDTYSISALTNLPSLTKSVPTSGLMQESPASSLFNGELGMHRFSPYNVQRSRPSKANPLPSVMDFLSAAVAAQTQKLQNATESNEPTGDVASQLPVVAILGAQDLAIENSVLNDVASLAFCDILSPVGSGEKVLNGAVAALLFHSTALRKEDLERFKSLKTIVCVGSGVDNVDVKAATEFGIAVCNTPAECVEETADSTMSLILNMYRKTFWLAKMAEVGKVTEDAHRLRELAAGCTRIRGSTLAIVGLGRVGTAVAIRARGFGFRVVFYDPLLPDGIDRALGLERCDNLEELLSRADCLTLHCPLTPDTIHMINEDTVKKMKPGAYLVNTSQRQLVSETALLDALKSCHIKAAALDLQSNFTDSTTAAICQLPNVLCTPNTAWYSDESCKESREAAAREIRRALRGRVPRDLTNCVNKQELLAAQMMTSPTTTASSPLAVSPVAAVDSSQRNSAVTTTPSALFTSALGCIGAQRSSRKQPTMSVDRIAAAIAAAATNANSAEASSGSNETTENAEESHDGSSLADSASSSEGQQSAASEHADAEPDFKIDEPMAF